MLTFDPEPHEYQWHGRKVPSVTSILNRLHDFAHVPMEVLETAQKKGSRVHLAAQLHDEGTLDETSVDVADVGYVDGWLAFCREHKPSWLAIEEPVYSSIYGFAGTPDRFCTLDYSGLRMTAQVDIKTSASSHPCWGLQTAAYNAAANREHVPRLTCQLRPNGTYKLLRWNDPTDWPVFLSLLNLSNWTKKHGLA